MLELKNLYKTYSSKNGVTHRALENVSLKFEEKGLVFILGKSGSGKSTLLNLIGGLDNYDRGDILFNGKSFSSFKASDYDSYRNSCIGFIFQNFNLLSNLNVFDNVALALQLQDKSNDALVLDMLDKMEVKHLKNRKASELSGGQKQRAAIARALIKDPSIILADEPTGSLDSETSDSIITILKELSASRLVIVVTHNRELAYQYGDRIIEIKDGFVLKDLARKELIKQEKEDNVTVSSNLIILPPNHQLTDENISNLNNAISLKRQDYYLLIEQDKRRVMSLYPSVKEVINDDNDVESFAPYVYNEDSSNKTYETNNNVKSNLPLAKGIRFGLSNLKRKKTKLFFTILLATLAVVILGCASNFTNYSLSKAVGSSIQHDNGQTLEVTSSFALSDANYKLQSNDIDFFNSLNKNVSYSYDSSMTYYYSISGGSANSGISNDNLFKSRKVYGYISTDSVTNLGYGDSKFKVIYEKENITKEDELKGVYISSIMAETIVYYDQYEKKKFTSIADLINTTARFGSYTYTILGIYDIDENESLYHHFESLHTGGTYDLLEEYNKIASSVLLRLIVSPSFMENYIETKNAAKFGAITTSYLDNDISNVNSSVSRNLLFNLKNYDYTNASNSYRFFDDSISVSNVESYISSLKENEIVVGRNYLKNIIGVDVTESNMDEVKTAVNKWNNEQHRLQIIDNSATAKNCGTLYALDNVKIVGVVYNNVGDSSTSGSNRGYNGIYVNNSCYVNVMNTYYRPNKAIISMDGNENYALFVQKLYDNGYTIDDEFVSYFVQFVNVMERFSIAINAFAVIWFIITALLLYSFMSGSVKDNSRQIGILKALGANIKDIYKIYTVEAVVIGIISTILGVLAYYFGGQLINYIITDQFYTFYFTIFIFEPISIITMVLLTFVVLFVSLIIPISKVKNINPIEVMNSN